MSQLDWSLRRDFFVREKRSLQLRIEAFNALNHPNFADPIRFLDSPLFGQSGSMLNRMLGTGSYRVTFLSTSASRAGPPVASRSPCGSSFDDLIVNLLEFECATHRIISCPF